MPLNNNYEGFPLDSAEIFKNYERKSLIIPDRTVETVSAWLLKHPSIKVVSRDGSSEYASAITKGAPQARQVSDRWHLGVRRIGTCWIPFGERRG